MPDKFTIESHEQKMRDLLKPKPRATGGDLLTKLRDLTKRRKAGAETKPPVVPEV